MRWRRPAKLLALAGLAALCAAAPALAAGGPESRPYSFVVPVSLSKLHKNLTLLRVRCWVMTGTDWHVADENALGEGVSGPEDTPLSHGTRSFSGDVTVNVPLRDPRLNPALAHSYRCQVELYDSAGRIWGDAAQINKRYPLRKGGGATETGGLIAR